MGGECWVAHLGNSVQSLKCFMPFYFMKSLKGGHGLPLFFLLFSEVPLKLSKCVHTFFFK